MPTYRQPAVQMYFDWITIGQEIALFSVGLNSAHTHTHSTLSTVPSICGMSAQPVSRCSGASSLATIATQQVRTASQHMGSLVKTASQSLAPEHDLL